MAATGEPTIPPAPPVPEPEVIPPTVPPITPPMAPPPKRITSGGIIAIVGGILMLVSVVLPWATISGGGISFSFSAFDIGQFGGPGTELMIYSIVGLLMGILAIVVVAAKKPVLAGVFGIIGLVVLIVAMFRIGWVSMSDPLSGITVSGGPGFGVYLGIVGAILAMIGGFVGHKQM